VKEISQLLRLHLISKDSSVQILIAVAGLIVLLLLLFGCGVAVNACRTGKCTNKKLTGRTAQDYDRSMHSLEDIITKLYDEVSEACKRAVIAAKNSQNYS
jgi:hypothetical protein